MIQTFSIFDREIKMSFHRADSRKKLVMFFMNRVVSMFLDSHRDKYLRYNVNVVFEIKSRNFHFFIRKIVNKNFIFDEIFDILEEGISNMSSNDRLITSEEDSQPSSLRFITLRINSFVGENV